MRDIFDAKISCENCNTQMVPIYIDKQGFRLRAVQCPKCNERIVHPLDLEHFNRFNNLKNKTFSVKLRIVGNSHAVSIPKEIVDFINQTHGAMHKHMNDVVRLCFEDFGRLSLSFVDKEEKN